MSDKPIVARPLPKAIKLLIAYCPNFECRRNDKRGGCPIPHMKSPYCSGYDPDPLWVPLPPMPPDPWKGRRKK